ncbi:MAG: PHP domain-containing protein [Bacilli bacterium]|nr:PHP domain-containing protein [Bacilli bacterium]
MVQNFDFHIHSKYSDGEYDVETIINKLNKSGITNFAITDHDNVESVDYLRERNLNNISGVEMSSRYNNLNMHILGYYIDGDLDELKKLCNRVSELRKARLYEHVSKLEKEYNLQFDELDLMNLTKKYSTLGRPHIGKLLIKYGYVSSMEEAFKKYLFNVHSSIFYRMDAKLVIDAIHKAGGIAILAHPKKIEDKYNIDIEDFLPDLVEIGIDGIEIYNSLHYNEDSKRYKEIATKYNLLISGGSDYHGPNVKPNVKLGYLNNEDLPKINIDEMTFKKS